MNKTFKVVFNRARQGLMVANEITSSVQKKGVKTIVAASVAGALAVTSGFALALDHKSDISTLENQTISGDVSIAANGWGGYLYVGSKDFTSSGNTYSVNATYDKGSGAYGGVIAMYAKGNNGTSKYTANFTNDKFVGNTFTATGSNTKTDWNGGGAITVKGYTVNFTDVLFKDNKVVSKVTGSGSVAAGGAVNLDKTISGENSANTTANFTFNKDITYSGNTVTTDNPSATTTNYGGAAYTSGGFLFMDRQSTANFIVADGATFTLGILNNSDTNADTIASSLTSDKDANSYGGHNLITKQGGGTFIVNSSLNDYNGKVEVQAGTMKVNSDWKIRNTVTIKGGTLDLSESNFEFSSISSSVKEFNEKFSQSIKVESTAAGSIVLNGGTLQTKLTQVFGEKATLEDSSFSDAASGFTLTSGTLALVDSGNYTSDSLTALKSKTGAVTLSLVNATLKSGTAKLVDNVIQETATAEVEVTDSTATIGSSGITTGAATVKLTDSASVTVNGAVTLVGTTDGSSFIENATAIAVANNATLNLGSVNSTEATAGTLPELTLNQSSTLNVTNTSISTTALTVADSASNVKINIGSSESAGSLHADTVKLNSSIIFIDPAWQGSTELDLVEYASYMSVGSVGEGDLNGTIVAGQNSVLALGATKDTAAAGFNSIAKNSSLVWGENGSGSVTAALYVGHSIALTDSTKILVNGSLTSLSAGETAANDVSNASVTVASKGLLMIDQSAIGSSTVFTGGTLTLTGGSYIGLVNATGENLTLTAAGSTTGDSDEVTVVTDNPFVTAKLASNTIISTVNAATGLQALASTGLQAMTRRADSILAQTIADRTSVDQELVAGANLWVDVAGETYEADKLDNNASFKADMGYGAFGAEFGIGDTATAGAAIQYGKGSLRSSVYSIKNSIDSYGATIYGTMKFGESKVVADIAYVKNTNDITSSRTALNQKPDTQMYSIGVRGQHRFTAGNFQIVPSVGVRVSRLETDSMAIGSVKVKKQKQNIVQVPIALRINGVTQNAAGWAISPSFKVAYVPTFGDKEITALGADQTVIDTSPVQADFGIRAQKGNLMLNANFMAGTGNDGASSIGGKVGLKYVF